MDYNKTGLMWYILGGPLREIGIPGEQRDTG